MHRIDIVLNERELGRVCKAIRKTGAQGYSVLRHVTGMGVAGEISEAMDFSGLGANALVIVFCAPEQIDALRQAINPLLKLYGGVAFLSAAEPL